jgi:hypothetical protein
MKYESLFKKPDVEPRDPDNDFQDYVPWAGKKPGKTLKKEAGKTTGKKLKQKAAKKKVTAKEKNKRRSKPKVVSSESESSSSSSSSESSSEVDLLESVERVHDCPPLDEDNLLPGRVFWRYFANEGWSRGIIVSFRANRKRSNITAHFDDEETSVNRDVLLKTDEYLIGERNCWILVFHC